MHHPCFINKQTTTTTTATKVEESIQFQLLFQFFFKKNFDQKLKNYIYYFFDLFRNQIVDAHRHVMQLVRDLSNQGRHLNDEAMAQLLEYNVAVT